MIRCSQFVRDSMHGILESLVEAEFSIIYDKEHCKVIAAHGTFYVTFEFLLETIAPSLCIDVLEYDEKSGYYNVLTHRNVPLIYDREDNLIPLELLQLASMRANLFEELRSHFFNVPHRELYKKKEADKNE